MHYTAKQNRLMFHCTKSVGDDFLSKFEQVNRKLQACSHLLKKSLTENFIFCEVSSEEALQENKTF